MNHPAIRRKTGKILLWGVAGCLALLLVLMLGAKLAFDRAPRYQAQIRDWVYLRTGYHVAFASVSPTFRWYGPELYFDRLELRSRDDRRVLARAAGGRVGADLWQLFHSGKWFALKIELDAPSIAIARLGPDRFALASEIGLAGGGAPLDTLALNDLPAGSLAIRHGFVTVQDWNPALPRLELRGVYLDLRRAPDLAVARLSAQLPPALGGTLSFDGTAHGAGPLAGLDWNLLASADGMSFPGWRELLPEYLTRLDAGSGGFDALLHGRGPELERATLNFGAKDVVTNLTDGPSARFEQISGTLTVTHSGDHWTLAGRRMRAQRAGRRDPDSEFDVSWLGNDSGMLNLRARASYLRAETLLPLAGLMPQKELRDRLRDVAPTGEWLDMRAELKRASTDDPWRFQVAARFHDMGFAPMGSSPGLRGLAGELAGNQDGGHLIIDAPAAVFNWPHQLPGPLPLAPFKTTLYWKRTPAELLVATRDLKLRTHGTDLDAKLALELPSDGGSPVLTLASSIEHGNAADAHLFFPKENLAPQALAWLDRAFIAGRMTHAEAVISGPLRHFPFRDGSGLFLVRCNLDGLTLDYREGWPRIEGLAVQAEFRNEGLTARVTSGRTGGLALDAGSARFADFSNGELEIHVNAHGDASDAVGFMRATPLDEMAEHAFSDVDASGRLDANIELFLPFQQFDHRRVRVHLRLDGAAVSRKGSSLRATDIGGEADIDGAQVAHADLHGRALGGAFQMTARVPRGRGAARTQLDFHGTLSGDALRSALSLPPSLPFGGQTDWHAVLRMAPEPARERSLRVSSSLAGLDLDLPAPLTKPAAAELPVSVETQWPASGGAQVRIALGSVLRGAVSLDSDPDGPKLKRAALSFGAGEPAFSDTETVNVGGSIGELDLDGWQKLAAAAKGARPLASYFRSAKLNVGRLSYLGLALQQLDLDLHEANGAWRIGVGGPNVVGTVLIPGAQDPGKPWTLEFERFDCDDAAQDSEPAAPEAGPATHGLEGLDPRTLPAIEFHAAEVTWGDRQFGAVQGSLAKVEDGVSLTQLKLSSATFSANLEGEWRGKNAGTSRLAGTVTSSNVGETLKRLGFAEVIDAKSGHLDFDLAWVGAPSAAAMGAATGHVQVALDKGQISGLKPGARGRVLGLASVAELPRRLALDFSDVTDKGFAFDTVRGDFDIKDGGATTDNVLVKGPAADIGVIGRVGLKNKDYDQIAVVTGNVGSSPLPLAAFAAGPVVGGAVLLFTQVFKQPLRGLVRGYYRISGGWDNPTVERITSADAAAATAEAPK